MRAERERRRAEKEAGSWQAEKDRCRADILHWWDTYLWTYDPRLIGTSTGAWLRFNLWPKQREIVLWLLERIQRREEGLVEKSRDTGVSYLCTGVALHQWLFEDGFKATFGSRVVDDVDQKDNPDSLFQKLRIMIDRLPPLMLPAGFDRRKHDTYLQLTNPATGAIISGEGGEHMGRGGRSTVYVLDEAAHVPHAEKVEKALSGNTDCVIWVSSVQGMGNLFARKRHGILKPHQIQRLHWRDDPRKTEEWAQAKQDSLSDPTTWASEYDIDYTASLDGVCIPAKWVESAKRLAAVEPRVQRSNRTVGGLDVGAGKAKSVLVLRSGPVVSPPQARGDPDTTDTALWALEGCKEAGAQTLNFDSVGVGAGVASTLTKNRAAGLRAHPINVGEPPTEAKWPDGRTSDEMFGNLKAELWWLARTAFQRTHEHILHLEGKDGGREHPVSDLIALPAGDRESDALATQLSLVRWMRNERGKIVIEKKAELARRGVASPDHAEAFMLTFGRGRSSYDSSMDWV